MPSVPVRNPEIGRPGKNGACVVSAPWKASSRVPAGSAKAMPARTPRSCAAAAGSRSTAILAASSRPANASSSAASATSQPNTFWVASSEETTILCLRSSMRNLSALGVRSTSWSPRNLGAYSAQSSNLSERRPTYPKAATDMVRPPAGERTISNLAASGQRTQSSPGAALGTRGGRPGSSARVIKLGQALVVSAP